MWCMLVVASQTVAKESWEAVAWLGVHVRSTVVRVEITLLFNFAFLHSLHSRRTE